MSLSDVDCDSRKASLASDDGQNDPQKSLVYDHWQWIVQLSPLASQHHTSEYSRLKYGHQGCPALYAPSSLHLPDLVRGLRERQERYVHQVLWWPCPATTILADRGLGPLIPAVKQRAALATGESISHPGLEQELSNALSESIAVHRRPNANTPSHVKTSESHPINVSQIIPPESIIAISSHLIPCKKPFPVLFELRLPHCLDLIAGQPHLYPSRIHPSTAPLSSTSIPSALSPQHKRLSSNEYRSSVTGALNAAISARIPLPPLPVSSSIFLSLKRNLRSRNTPDPAPVRVADATTKSAPRHSTTQMVSQASQNHLPSMLALPTYALHPFSPYTRLPTAPSPPSKVSKFRIPKTSSVPCSRPDTVNQKLPRLGNLLLSSCPGKKVRLSGPLRGRSAVSRDLDIDLRRMRMLGARCIVCCLDDEELEFLVGASWIEYCQAAHQEGLDVLRIPLPEGLAPLSPKSLDSDLDRIIQMYTLQGISVLVHCRGGVGRAGLFACCWMLKLGLCGWIETDIASSADTATSVLEIKHDDSPSESLQWDSETVVRRDTLQLVERVIEVVRRRRSVKAIETLEQVQFLVEYVDYLRTCGRPGVDSGNS